MILVPIESNFGPILHRFWDTSENCLFFIPLSYSAPCSLRSLWWNFAVKLSVRKS